MRHRGIAILAVIAVVLTAAALLLLRPASPALPQPALEELLDRGLDAERREDHPKALDAYGQAVARYPEAARAWAFYGEALRFYAHKPEAAQEAFERAVTAPQSDPEARALAYRGLGELAWHDGRSGEALHWFSESLAANPLVDTRRSLCALLATQGDFPSALVQAQLAVETDATDPIALVQYATQLERAGRHAEGRQAFGRALHIAGCDAEGHAAGHVHCCVLYNAAGYYAVCGNPGGSLHMLQAFFLRPNHRHISRAEVLNDPDFVALRASPEFVALLDRHLPPGQR